MKRTVVLLTACILTLSSAGFAQSGIKKADKKYDSYAYIDAIKTYERIAEKGYKSADMFQKLGNAYFFNSDLANAVKWYDRLFAMTDKVTAEYYYRYAQSLKSVGQYEKADRMMQTFASKSNDIRGKLFATNTDYLQKIEANSGRFSIEDAGMNSEYSDYGSAIVGDQIVFASARDTGGIIKRKHKWTNESFTNLYSAQIIGDSLGKVDKFAKDVRSKFHESTPVFSSDGRTMYFTRNNYNEGKKGKNSKKITLLKIYQSKLENEGQSNQRWSDAVSLPFNSDNYSTAHPALSTDGKILYFASDMPGTKGQSDLFMVTIDASGNFGKPQNLGSINTEGRESFPFVAGNELYFATDGHPGLGGLDIFVSTISADGSFSSPENIGKPANSPQDDFAFLINPETRRGFLSSNRTGGKGNDDIYKFVELRSLVCEQALSGVVTDLNSGEILKGATITISDSKFTVLQNSVSDNDGNYRFTVECGKTYYIKAEKESYSTAEVVTIIPRETGKTEVRIQLEKSSIKVAVGDDLAVTLKLNPIYFDRDKSFIRADAALELEKVLDVLHQNPKMSIDIRSHTDSRQTHKYNERLSDARAKATMAWLITNGIAADRLTGKGFGETRLLNKCADGIDCTEEEHQLNRRSEFIITSLGE